MTFTLPRSDFAHVFARPTEAADPDVPRGKLVRAAARRTAMLAEAADVLRVLPGPGEALHALMTGRYDLTALLVVLFDRLGPCADVRIATLSYNGRNVAELLKQIDAGNIGRLTLLCSLFFREHNPAEWTKLQDGLAERPGGHRQAAARSYALRSATAKNWSWKAARTCARTATRSSFALSGMPACTTGTDVGLMTR